MSECDLCKDVVFRCPNSGFSKSDTEYTKIKIFFINNYTYGCICGLNKYFMAQYVSYGFNASYVKANDFKNYLLTKLHLLTQINYNSNTYTLIPIKPKMDYHVIYMMTPRSDYKIIGADNMINSNIEDESHKNKTEKIHPLNLKMYNYSQIKKRNASINSDLTNYFKLKN